MTELQNPLQALLSVRNPRQHSQNKYEKFGLRFNPFPKSGTSSLNNWTETDGYFEPTNPEVIKAVYDFIYDSLYAVSANPKDKFLSAAIIGDYGSGKTQLLLYIGYLLNLAVTVKEPHKNPFVIYIDNPGVKLSELVGSIIKKIGEENFKKYVWNTIISELVVNEDHKSILKGFQPSPESALFRDLNPNPYAKENLISYKKFIDVWLTYLPVKQRKPFEKAFKQVIISILSERIKDATISKYFYDLLSEDYEINKTWELLAEGHDRSLDKKEVQLINQIISLVKEQGYTDFFILVDEFEDITEGRLSKVEIDNYLRNLRTLIDQNREWRVVFAMTARALDKIKLTLPPLADRLTNREIQLSSLNEEEVNRLVIKYLNLARENQSNDLKPFSGESLKILNEKSKYNTRTLVKNCFKVLERATSDTGDIGLISVEFIDQVITETE